MAVAALALASCGNANEDVKHFATQLAEATGWVEKGMNDAQLAERLNDTLFVASLKQQALNQVKSGLNLKGWEVDLDKSGMKIVVSIKVNNSLDAPVKGADYSVTSVVLNGGPIFTKKLSGVDIEAGGTATLSYRLGVEYSDWFKDARNTLHLNISEDEALYRFYKADGNEYKRYLMSKGA